MADGMSPHLVVTERWDLATNTVCDVTLRIIDAPEVSAVIGEETSGIVAVPSVGTPILMRARTSAVDFEAACKAHLGSNYEKPKDWLVNWHDTHITALESPGILAFMAELGESVAGTPQGQQRRSAASDNSDFEKFRSFLEKLYWKCKMQSEDL